MCSVKREIGGPNRPHDGAAGRLKCAINPNKTLKMHAVGSVRVPCTTAICCSPGYPEREPAIVVIAWVTVATSRSRPQKESQVRSDMLQVT